MMKGAKIMKKEIALNVFYTLDFIILIRYIGIMILYFSIKQGGKNG